MRELGCSPSEMCIFIFMTCIQDEMKSFQRRRKPDYVQQYVLHLIRKIVAKMASLGTSYYCALYKTM